MPNRRSALVAIAVATGVAAGLAGCVPLPAPEPPRAAVPSVPAPPSPSPVPQPAPVAEGGSTVAEVLAARGESLPAAITAAELQAYFPIAVEGIPDRLPAGYAYPPEVPPAHVAGPAGMFESSYPDALALQSWQCSWYHFLGRNDDDASVAIALEHLALVGELPQSYTLDLAAYDDHWASRVEEWGSPSRAAAAEVRRGCQGAVVAPAP